MYGRYLKKLSNRTQEALGEMSQVAQESLSALRTVQAFNAQPWEEGKFASKVNKVLELGKKEAWASAIFFGAWHLPILVVQGSDFKLLDRFYGLGG